MKLDLNVAAPHFNEKDIFGRQIDLSNYKEKKLFIGFFRHAGCPFCNLRVHTLTKVHRELQAKGLEMIFFFESKQEVLLRSIFHKEVSPIPLISDFPKKIYSAYGLEPSKSIAVKSHITSFVQTALTAAIKKVPMHMMADGESFNTIPAEFLIDKGTIKNVYYAQNLTDRMSMDVIHAFAENWSALS